MHAEQRMQRSAGRPAGSASTRVRPASSSTRWKRLGPSPSRTPVQSDVYGFMRSPVDGAREQLQEDLEVAEARDRLLDPHHGDQHLGQRRAHAAVALGLDDADGAGVGGREVRAGDRDPRPEERLAQVQPCRLRELGRLVREARPPEALAEEIPDLGPVLVDRGHEQVRRPLSRELDDQLGEVGLERPDPGRLEASLSRISSVASDFTFTTSSAPSARTSAVTISFASAASRAQWTTPPAACTDASSSHEHLVEPGERLVLDRRPGRAKLLPVGHLADDGRRACARIVVVAWAMFARSCAVRERLRRRVREALGPRVAGGAAAHDGRGSRRGGAAARPSPAGGGRRRCA